MVYTPNSVEPRQRFVKVGMAVNVTSHILGPNLLASSLEHGLACVVKGNNKPNNTNPNRTLLNIFVLPFILVIPAFFIVLCVKQLALFAMSDY
jgi:hypothetical protein